MTHWEKNQIESEYWSQEERDYHSSNNLGRALIEYIPDSHLMTDTSSLTRDPHQCRYREDGRLQYFVTDLGEKMSYTIQSLNRICDYPKRCRVTKTPPQFKVDWHSHHNWGETLEPPYFMGVVQIPIRSPKNCFYEVQSQIKKQKSVFSQYYAPGEAWLFNSYHQHSVRNESDESRISVFATFSLDYEPFLKFLEKPVASYRGDRL